MSPPQYLTKMRPVSQEPSFNTSDFRAIHFRRNSHDRGLAAVLKPTFRSYWSGKDWYQGTRGEGKGNERRVWKTQCWASCPHVKPTVCKVSSTVGSSSRAHPWQPAVSCWRDNGLCRWTATSAVLYGRFRGMWKSTSAYISFSTCTWWQMTYI